MRKWQKNEAIITLWVCLLTYRYNTKTCFDDKDALDPLAWFMVVIKYGERIALSWHAVSMCPLHVLIHFLP